MHYIKTFFFQIKVLLVHKIVVFKLFPYPTLFMNLLQIAQNLRKPYRKKIINYTLCKYFTGNRLRGVGFKMLVEPAF
jgi:hypothetical protein